MPTYGKANIHTEAGLLHECMDIAVKHRMGGDFERAVMRFQDFGDTTSEASLKALITIGREKEEQSLRRRRSKG